MLTPLKLLIVEDNPRDADLLLLELRRSGFKPDWRRVETEAELISGLTADLHLVLADFRLPGFNGFRALDIVRQFNPAIPFILISGTIGEELAATAIKQGAADYLLKDRLGRLGPAVIQALDASRLRTERRLADEARLTSEQLFRSTLENLMEGCQIIDRSWRYLYVNPVAARHSRTTVAELIGFSMHEKFPGLENTEVFSALRDCMENRVARKIETEFSFSDQSTAWFQVAIQPVPDGIFVLSLDITARKKAEESLRASEARFREMLENVQLIAITLDRDGRITFCNDYFLQVTGWTREEVMGGNWFDRFVPASEIDLKRRYSKAMAQSRIDAQSENRIKTKSGEIRDIAWNTTLLREATGAVRGTAGIGKDMTEANQAQSKIRAQLDELTRWQDVTVDREERLLALKREINDLLAEQKKPARYALPEPS